MKLHDTNLPWLKISTVWHVGTMQAINKGNDSIEGNGLSISVHPSDWARIARLGNTAFTVTNPGGKFLDAHAVPAQLKAEIEAWGIAQGYLVPRPIWELKWLDEEDMDTRFTYLPDAAAAALEAQAMRDDEICGVFVTELSLPVLTELAFSRLGFKLDAVLSQDIITTFWVEDCSTGDGVWWADRHDPCGLSAPRGVICLKRLPFWKISTPHQLF